MPDYLSTASYFLNIVNGIGCILLPAVVLIVGTSIKTYSADEIIALWMLFFLHAFFVGYIMNR